VNSNKQSGMPGDVAAPDHTLIVRKYPRYAVQLPVSFAFGPHEGDGTLYNLSMGGCRAVSDMEIPPNEYMRVRLCLSFTEVPVIVETAAVRWSAGKDFGLEFLVIDEEHKSRLRRFLGGIGGT
jgi:hypothetical protein